MHVHSFPPIEDKRCSILILGSMPGKASLQAQQYYAHPRNLFWKFMATLLGIDPDTAYEARLQQLLCHRIAVWDVLKNCTRHSSLDSDIVDATSVPNDFPAFFREHPLVSRVFFNGAKAESMFSRLVAPSLPPGLNIQQRRLPSTSPANASIPFEQKLEAWRVVVRTADCSDAL